MARWSVRLADGMGGGIALVVGGIGMAAGFTHTIDAAERAGQVGWLAVADAVVIECMVIVAGWHIHRDRRRAGRSIRFPAAVLAVAFVVQMGAQVSGAPRTFAGWLFAAVPALGALVVVKLAIRSAGAEPAPEDAPLEVVQAEADRTDVVEIRPATWPPRR